MSLVATKCPNCGASIMLDGGSQEGFCSYCGSKLKVQEIVQRVKIDKTGDEGNYLALAKVAYKGTAEKEAYEYVNKALELNVKNAQAWLFKLKVMEMETRLHFGRRALEAIACGNKVIELDSSLACQVYQLWLETAKDFLALRTAAIPENVLCIEELNVLEPQVMSLRRAVPTNEIAKDATLAKLTLDLAEAWGDYEYCADKYGDTIGYATLKKYQEFLDEILEGIPEEEKENNPNFKIFYENNTPHSQQKSVEPTDDSFKGCLLLIVFFIIIVVIYNYI